MDKGGEYRSLLGLPGGTSHPQYQLVQAAAEARGMILKEGKGNDPDTLGKRIVYVMDSNKFPFYQAEVCKYCTTCDLFSNNVTHFCWSCTFHRRSSVPQRLFDTSIWKRIQQSC
jgi:hypothetical protein